MTCRVHAIIPAFARPQLLARALASLEDQGPALARVIVVNNSGDAETARVTVRARVPTHLVDPGCNLGTAGGIGAGMCEFLKDAAATHAWILDDDACATPGALAAMASAAEEAGADAVAPLLLDENGSVHWLPGPFPRSVWECLRRQPSPAEFRSECGNAVRPCRWAYWASLLVSRRAIGTVGFPRMDLWSQFTDMEYTLRLTARFRAVLAPGAVCAHCPPAETPEEKRRKIFAGLQSGAYASVRLRHCRPALRHLPGMYFRVLRHCGWRADAWRDAARAFVRGAMAGKTPADGECRAAFTKAEAAFPGWRGPEKSASRP